MKKKLLIPLLSLLFTSASFSQSSVTVHADDFESPVFPSSFSKSANAAWNTGGGSDYTGTFWDGLKTTTASTQISQISTAEHYTGNQSLKLTITAAAAALNPKLFGLPGSLGDRITDWWDYEVSMYVKVLKPDGSSFGSELSVFKNSVTLTDNTWKKITLTSNYADNVDAGNIAIPFANINEDYVVYIDDIVIKRLYNEWTGAASSDWNANGNWLNGAAPLETENVYIPAGTANVCTVGSAGVKCNDLLIQSGSTLVVNSGSDITINSTTSNSGTITNNGTFTTKANGIYQSTGGLMNGTGTYTLESGATLSVDNANGLSSTTGAIRCTTRNYNAAANYILSGSTAQTTSGAPGSINDFPAQVNNLTVNNAAGATITGSLTVNGDLTLTQGVLSTSLFVLYAKGNVSGNGSINSGDGTLYFYGTNTQTFSPTVDGDVAIAPFSKVTNTGTMNGRIFINSNGSGTGTFINNGSIAFSSVSVQQDFAVARNYYITSPTSSSVAPSTNITNYYEYVEAGNNSDLSVSGSSSYWLGKATGFGMEVGKGYIAKLNAPATTAFTGTLNNDASYAIPVTRTNSADKPGFNLVGNPYAAYIDWSAVIADADNTNIGTTLWFRTQNTSSQYTFTTHNGTSGQTVSGTANTSITKYIPPMQGFWIRVNDGTATTNLTLKKSMLSHSNDADNKLKAPAANSTPSLRLQVSNGVYTDEALIYQSENALDAYDTYDSQKMMNEIADMPELYTLVGSEKLVINGLKTIAAGTETPIGFKTEKTNSYSFRMSQLINMPSDIQVVLKDKVNGTEQVMVDGSVYNFTSDAVNTTSRFSLLFRSASSSTGLQKPAVAQKYGVYTNGSNAIVVDLYNDNASAQVELYNMSGTRVGAQKVNSSNSVLDFQPASGVCLVKIKDGDHTELHRVILR